MAACHQQLCERGVEGNQYLLVQEIKVLPLDIRLLDLRFYGQFHLSRISFAQPKWVMLRWLLCSRMRTPHNSWTEQCSDNRPTSSNALYFCGPSWHTDFWIQIVGFRWSTMTKSGRICCFRCRTVSFCVDIVYNMHQKNKRLLLYS